MVEITYICKRTVVSTKPVELGKIYSFSVLDRLMEQNHLRIVYYFQTQRVKVPGKMTENLRESLSEMLTSFPMVTGRLVKGQERNWMIKCNDAGVRMVEARAKGSVEEWLKSVDREKELKLIHWEDMLDQHHYWSTFYVQITEFEKGGLAIGFSCTHLLADLTCVFMFIKAWADTTLAGKMQNPPIFSPLPSRNPGDKNPLHKPNTHLINHYKSTFEKSTSTTTNTRYATIVLSFTDPMVRACMNQARPTGSLDRESPSPFDALAGMFWVCISNVRGIRNGLIDMSICLDARKILGLENGFFGNCMVYGKVEAQSIKEPKSLSSAAEAISEAVPKLDKEGIVDLIEWLGCKHHQAAHLPMNGCDLICASCQEMDPYSAIFEEGLDPLRVSYHVGPDTGVGRVLILPAPPGDEGPLGRVTIITLPHDEIIKLCEDELILQFSPTALMGPSRN